VKPATPPLNARAPACRDKEEKWRRVRWPTAMAKLRIVTVGISGGRSLTRPFRDAHRFPLYTIVARSHVYTHAAKFWDLCIVQGPFSTAPCQTLALRFATVASLYAPVVAPRAGVCNPAHHVPEGEVAGLCDGVSL
jgi:hypothetical protein